MLSKINKKLAWLLAGICVLLLMVRTAAPVAAASRSTAAPSTAPSQNSSTPATIQGYGSANPLQVGMIVELTGAGADMVQPVDQADAGHMYGVTVDPNNLPFTISSSGLANEVYVATSGTYDTLVSTEGGTIAQGNFITVSSIDGVGMAAGTDNTTVFGRASEAFDGGSAGIGSETLKKSNGTTETVTLGIIPVAIQIEHNPDKQSTKVNLPKALQRLGQAVAEKPIGPLRTYLSIAITGLSIIISIVILYAGVRNSLVALGRNPLSKRPIFRGLLEIILTSIIVLIIGLFAVYLLLKL